MNIESKMYKNDLGPEAYLDRHIEALKESHPHIDKEKYWTAFRKAKIAQGQLLELLAPPAASGAELGEAVWPQEAGTTDIDNGILRRLVKDCPDRYKDCNERLAGAFSGDVKLFRPGGRPLLDKGSNQFFGAEKLGIPELLPNVFVVPDDNWFQIFPESLKFDENLERHVSEFGGCYLPRKMFNPDNLLGATGISVIAKSSFSKMIESARHESVHAVDFIGDERKGIHRLIAEFIAYRIDGLLSPKSANKRGRNQIRNFIDSYAAEYVLDYAKDQDISVSQVEIVVENSKKAVGLADEHLGFEMTTQFLLNSSTLMEFVDSVKEKVQPASTEAA